jgi:hypothetical protein
MALQAGDYLENITIKHCALKTGAGIFQHEELECYVLNKDLPDLTFARGVKIDKLVCVRFDEDAGRYFCMPPGCYQSLIEALYNQRGYLRPWMSKAKDLVWLGRWRDIVLNGEKVDCKPVPKGLVAEIAGRQWMLLCSDHWEMPVSVPCQQEILRGDASFFPCPMRDPARGTIRSFIAPTYRADTHSPWPMIHLSGQFDLRPTPPGFSANMALDIYVHPFISPRKWHFGVWKHCFGMKKNEERRYWEHLFSAAGLQAFPKEDGREIFSECRINSVDSNCSDCVNPQYQNVHNSIKPFLHFYQKMAVTFFQKIATRKTGAVLLSAEPVGADVYIVEIAMKGSPLESGDQLASDGVLHMGIYRGTLFIGDQAGVMHVSPVTQYSTSSGALNSTMGSNVHIGIVRNVQKSN